MVPTRLFERMYKHPPPSDLLGAVSLSERDLRHIEHWFGVRLG